MSCGIDTGSNGGGGLQPPLQWSSAEVFQRVVEAIPLSDCRNWLRDVMSSFGKIRYRCEATVRCDKYRCWPISRLERPSAAIWAIWSSWAVSWSRASGGAAATGLTGRSKLLTRPLSPRDGAQGIERIACRPQGRSRGCYVPPAAEPGAVAELRTRSGEWPLTRGALDRQLEEPFRDVVFGQDRSGVPEPDVQSG
jgi:hypothetical protein